MECTIDFVGVQGSGGEVAARPPEPCTSKSKAFPMGVTFRKLPSGTQVASVGGCSLHGTGSSKCGMLNKPVGCAATCLNARFASLGILCIYMYASLAPS